MAQTKPTSQDLAFVNSVNEAILEQTPRGASSLLWFMVLFVVAAIGWASWATLDELVRAEGEIIPSQQLQVVQNLEGGILSEVLVSEGDVVSMGQVLMRIEDERFSSSVRENEVRFWELAVKIARLQAESQGGEYTPVDGLPVEYANLELDEKRLMEARSKELITNQDVLSAQLQQRKQELIEARDRLQQVSNSYKLLQRELAITEPLFAEGVIAEVEVLRLKRQVSDLKGEQSAISLSLPRLESSVDEIEQRLSELRFKFQSLARSEYNELLAERSRLSETLNGMQDRIRRTEVRSPLNGTIKELMLKTRNAVVKPGDPLLSIVPSEDRLLVEAKLAPADIGHLELGQKARMNVSAYDFSIYGGAEGSLLYISPSTFLNEQGEAYFLARFALDDPFLDAVNQRLPLMAGMTVSVDVLTGKRTVLDYLMKPILKARSKALTEP